MHPNVTSQRMAMGVGMKNSTRRRKKRREGKGREGKGREGKGREEGKAAVRCARGVDCSSTHIA